MNNRKCIIDQLSTDPTPDSGDGGKMVYPGHQDLVLETPLGSAITIRAGVPTLWLGLSKADHTDRLALCAEGAIALWNECQKTGMPFTLWNLPSEEFGGNEFDSEEDIRDQLESAVGIRVKDTTFQAYLVACATANCWAQLMDMEKPSVSDVKTITAFMRQILRVFNLGKIIWPVGLGSPPAVYEEMENLVLTLAQYPAASRMPPPEVSGWIKRNYVPTIAGLQANLIATGEEYLITEDSPPCGCFQCQVMGRINLIEKMVEEIHQALSDDDTAEDVRHPDDI